jgi:hypothetical protein
MSCVLIRGLSHLYHINYYRYRYHAIWIGIWN